MLTSLATAGLKRTSEATRIVAQSGRTTTVDGPFAESKELVGGYAVLDAPSHEAAVEMGKEFVKLHTDNGWPDVIVEVRAIDGGINY